MKFRRFLPSLAFLAAAATTPAIARPAPKLVVVVAVDQLSADLFAQYRASFESGLKRLSEGVVFPSGYQSHNATETCPGHSTILTGARPARTGIIANIWYDLGAAREDKMIYCAEDERVTGSTHRDYTASPFHLRVPALGDHMKRADPRSRVAVVAGKDRSAMMMGGHGPDQRWWWNGIEYTGINAHVPASVGLIAKGISEAVATARDPLPLPPRCAPQSRSVAVGERSVGADRFARAAGDRTGFRASPDFDGSTLAMAQGLRDEMRLGEGPATDLLIVGLAATDYVGHTFGTQGSEMCIQLLALDHLLGDFFVKLDATAIDYAVVLTADHGASDLPERQREKAIPAAARVDPALRASTMGKALGQRLRLKGEVLHGDSSFGDMYLDRGLTVRQRKRVLQHALAAYRTHPQVEAVFTREQLAAAPVPSGPPDSWSLMMRAKASFDPLRSGDFIVLLKPLIMPISDPSRGYVATHGSPWDYDRRVPILFWRKGAIPFEQPIAVETVDILPTLAAVIGLSLPAGSIDGRCLDLDPGPGDSCAPE